MQRTDCISICLHVDLQPGCLSYTIEPSSVVSSSERMEGWQSLCSFCPYGCPYWLYLHNPRGHGNGRVLQHVFINLSFLSKVVERAAAARLSAHFESQQLLPSRQSARHSTETAITAVHDEIVKLKAIDAGEVCALVLLDLSIAFDIVAHQTLLRELRCRFGVTDAALSWCSYYYYYYN